MPVPFARSLRSIEGGGHRVGRWLVVPALALLAGWGAWMVRAEVPLHAASASARLVRERAVVPIQSAVDGRVVALHVALDQEVRAGDLLLELDGRTQELALAEERARLEALAIELEAARSVVATLESAQEEARAAVTAARREAELELESRRIASRYAAEEAERLTQLEGTGDVSKIAAARARAEAEKTAVAVQAQEATLARLAVDARRDAGDRAAALAEQRRVAAQHEAARAVHASTIARLEHELDQRHLRAPAAGVVAELPPLAPGTVVRAGDDLGSIVSGEGLAVVAGFAPAEAMGRVRIGQPGELSLAGFPRAEYGALPVRVAAIAGEPREGLVRVELALVAPERARVPLEHGLPGSVSIEVERASPATLLLRAVGGALGLTRGAGSDG